jgi:hypothetical protein
MFLGWRKLSKFLMKKNINISDSNLESSSLKYLEISLEIK